MDFHFLKFMDTAAGLRPTLPTEYDPALVILSYLTTVIASSAALLIVWRLHRSLAGRSRVLWLSLGALTLGMGVWAMHFVAMLAMSLPVPIGYDVPITLISIMPAVAAGAVCLTGAIRGSRGWLIGGGVVMGLGIGAMHYVGMAAMRVNADMLYDPWLFVLSIAVAATLAVAALYTVRWAIRQTPVNPTKDLLLSGALMGLAVTAMHYTGMWAAHFYPLPDSDATLLAVGMDAFHLAILVVAAILAIVMLAVAAVLMDYRFKRLQAAANAEAEKFAHLLEAVPDGILGFNDEGDIQLLNSRVADLFGYRREALIGRPVALLLAESRDALRVLFDRDRAVPDSRLKLMCRRADQTEFPAEISLNRAVTTEGPLVICAIRDVSEQEQAREALHDTNERLTAGMSSLEAQSEELRYLTEMGELLHGCEEEQEAYDIISNSAGQLLAGMPGGVYMLSRSRNILQSTALWGQFAEPMAPVFSPTDCWALRRGRMYMVRDRRAATQCKHVGEQHDGYVCVPMLAHGEVLGVLHVVTPGNGAPAAPGRDDPMVERKRILLIAIAEKISSAVANLRLREELRNQSVRDPLTGLLNRRFMEEAFEREIVRAARMSSPLSVVAIDLDHFKRFNDTFGHEGGDLVLREVGTALSKYAGDNLACRLGGEELMVLLPGTTLESALEFAEKIRRKIEKLSVVLRGQQLGTITASFGVAEYPRHGEAQREVLRAADEALYRAKAEGRNRVVVAERVEDTTISVSLRSDITGSDPTDN